MSSNFPQSSEVYLHTQSGSDAFYSTPRFASPNPREWVLSSGLFLATLLTTSFAGMFNSLGDIGLFQALQLIIRKPGFLLYGLPFSLPLMLILLAHELGHYLACRYYGMLCTPPYFIPAPVSIAGTLGAFIRIKSPFPGRRALFDIGIAGPLAGFAFALPILFLGITFSRLIPKASFPPGSLVFGEPLIFQLVGQLLLGYAPERQDMIAHPTAMAAWIGLLATSLNLLPIWQLDGGHIAYAMIGRKRQRIISSLSLVALIGVSLMGWPTPSYLLLALLLLIMAWRVGFYHPATLSEQEAIGGVRIFLGLLALLILILTFIPVPVTIA